MTTLQSHTIDVGIDLGTTNSAIAVVLDGKPVMVPNNLNRPVTPSVVRLRANGALDVGDNAYRQLEFMPGDVAHEFKRWIGTEGTFTFEAAGRQMSAAELSSEVLKALRSDLHQRHGLEARAAVITVPAAFELNQCAATQRAAGLAGLAQAPLLQEPVAASLAYGFDADRHDGAWLVYDLGGGTFDLALVTVVDGRITVIDHEGDNRLGGKDFDWLIVEQLLLPRLAARYDVRSFQRGNEQRRGALAVLKAKAEELKIALSSSTAATVTIEAVGRALDDDHGVQISEDILVERSEYEAVVAETLSRTIELSRRILARHTDLPVESVVLVGGPTLSPVVRRRLGDELSLPINSSVDPMTAVAAGAALYAATIPIETTARAASGARIDATGEVDADLRFAAVTDTEETPLGITLADPRAVAVEVREASQRWTSGQLPLRGGQAVVRLPLLDRGQNRFSIIVYDAAGLALRGEPQTFAVTRGLTAAAAPLSRSLGVVVREDVSGRRVVEWMLQKDTALPARCTFEYRTTLALDPGGDVEIISVYLVEGEARRPERNRVVGHIEITDRDVPRRVPAGSPLQVTLEVSTSRLLSASVFLPLTDQTFAVSVRTEAEEVTPRALVQELLDERSRIEASAPQLSSGEIVQLNATADAVAMRIRAAESHDPDSSQAALMALKDLQQRLDQLDEAYEVPRAIDEAREERQMADSAVSNLGTDAQRQRLARASEGLENAVQARDLTAIERERSRLARLRFEVLAAQPWFWKEWFEHFEVSVTGWTDPAEAERLLRDGRGALLRGDVETLRHSTIRLSALAPSDPGYFANVELRR